MEIVVGTHRVQVLEFPTNKQGADVLLSYEKTIDVLTKFIKECYDFWLREGRDKLGAMRLALRDIYYTNRDPNEPCGKLLDLKAKIDFMKGDF